MKLPIDAQAVIRNLATTEYNIARAEAMDIGSLTHAIVKSAEEDKRLHLVAISRRLLYCCPLYEEDECSSAK